MIKKIIKWIILIFIVVILVSLFFDDEEVSSRDFTNSESTIEKTDYKVKSGLSVSDFKLNENINKTIKMLKLNGWQPFDGEYGDMESEYSGGYFSFMNAYGYVKDDGVFEGYDVPGIQISYDEYGKLAHFRIVINNSIDSTEVKRKLSELSEKEDNLYVMINDGCDVSSSDIYEMMVNINSSQNKFTPEIQTEFDKIREERLQIVEETKNDVREKRIKFCTEIENKCILNYGYSFCSEENEIKDGIIQVFGYKNKNGDICKFLIDDISDFETTYTLDYVSANYRNEEKLTNELMNDYY